MAERLTDHNKTGWALKLDDPQNEFEARQQLMSKFKLVCEKLGKLEDILEKYGIESVEELDKKLANFDNFMKGNKFETIEDLQNALNGKFIEVFDEKNKIWQDMVKNLTKTEQDRDTWKRACELACKKLNDCFNDEQIENGFCYRVDCFYQQAKKEKENEWR